MSKLNDIPRRNRLDLLTPVEMYLWEGLDKIEAIGAHPILTDVVNLLQITRDRLADWVDLPKAEVKTPDRLEQIEKRLEALEAVSHKQGVLANPTSDPFGYDGLKKYCASPEYIGPDRRKKKIC